MSTKLLDTCVLIDLIPGTVAAVDDHFGRAIASGDELMLSAVSILEFRFGAVRSRSRTAQLAALQRLLTMVDTVAFDDRDAVAAALVKSRLATAGQLIGPYDLLIAAQAVARGWTLVTSNAREFSRVDGLVLEDWRIAP